MMTILDESGKSRMKSNRLALRIILSPLPSIPWRGLPAPEIPSGVPKALR